MQICLTRPNPIDIVVFTTFKTSRTTICRTTFWSNCCKLRAKKEYLKLYFFKETLLYKFVPFLKQHKICLL